MTVHVLADMKMCRAEMDHTIFVLHVSAGGIDGYESDCTMSASTWIKKVSTVVGYYCDQGSISTETISGH